MAGRVLKKRRLVNPARRRRKMSNKQIAIFGTKRQKAALKNRRRRRNVTHHRRRRNQTGFVSQAEHAAERAIHSVERAAEDAIGEVTHAVNRGRRRNVGEILTVVPANPGRRRRRNKMAATRRRNRRRNRTVVHRRRNRRRLNARRNTGHRRRNYSRRNRNPRVVVRYRNRRRHNAHRRRNQGMGNWLGGDAGAVVGVLGGAAVTKIIVSFLPSNFQSGWTGYITTGIVAVVTGQVAGRMTSNRRLGNMMTVGGLVLLGLQIANDFFPQLQLPFAVSATPATSTAAAGTSGMGLLTSSNFYVPQVNMPGSMATFVPPAAIPQAVVVPATGMKGFGATGTSTMNSGLRRVGRLR